MICTYTTIMNKQPGYDILCIYIIIHIRCMKPYYIYQFMHELAHTCIYAYTYVNMHATCIHTYICVHVHGQISKHTYVNVDLFIYSYIYKKI